MNAAELYSADVMITTMNRLLDAGMLPPDRGALSVLDGKGRMLILPDGIDYRSLSVSDVQTVSLQLSEQDDQAPEGEGAVHLAIYRARPDIRSIVSAFPPLTGAFALCGKLPDLTLIPGAESLCGRVCRVEPNFGAVLEAFAGGASAVVFGDGMVMVGAVNPSRAYTLLETLELCAAVEHNAVSLGTRRLFVAEKHRVRYELEAAPVLKELTEDAPAEDDEACRAELCALMARACAEGLASAAYGSCAVRLSDGSFLVTPSDCDRFCLKPQDLIRVKAGACARGNSPSHAVRLIEKVFAANPECRGIWVAHPRCLSALAVTDGTENARLIPDWSGLRHAPRYPYGSNFLQPDMLAQAIASGASFCIIENDCVISTGSSLYEAYLRLAWHERLAETAVRSAVLRADT